jgi:hypothetical protein
VSQKSKKSWGGANNKQDPNILGDEDAPSFAVGAEGFALNDSGIIEPDDKDKKNTPNSATLFKEVELKTELAENDDSSHRVFGTM